jgi:hypothetical protein
MERFDRGPQFAGDRARYVPDEAVPFEHAPSAKALTFA